MQHILDHVTDEWCTLEELGKRINGPGSDVHPGASILVLHWDGLIDIEPQGGKWPLRKNARVRLSSAGNMATDPIREPVCIDAIRRPDTSN